MSKKQYVPNRIHLVQVRKDGEWVDVCERKSPGQAKEEIQFLKFRDRRNGEENEYRTIIM